MEYTYEFFKASADYVKSIVPYTPEVALILGSCLGPFADTIEDPIVIDYKDIPNLLTTTVESHAGKLIFGIAFKPRFVFFGVLCPAAHASTAAEIVPERRKRIAHLVFALHAYAEAETLVFAPDLVYYLPMQHTMLRRTARSHGHPYTGTERDARKKLSCQQ